MTPPVKNCPGCHTPLSPTAAWNALSRYGHGSLCSACGLDEALLGDFITQIYGSGQAVPELDIGPPNSIPKLLMPGEEDPDYVPF